MTPRAPRSPGTLSIYLNKQSEDTSFMCPLPLRLIAHPGLGEGCERRSHMTGHAQLAKPCFSLDTLLDGRELREDRGYRRISRGSGRQGVRRGGPRKRGWCICVASIWYHSLRKRSPWVSRVPALTTQHMSREEWRGVAGQSPTRRKVECFDASRLGVVASAGEQRTMCPAVRSKIGGPNWCGHCGMIPSPP